MRKTILAVLASSALLIAACGDDDDAGAGDPDDTSSDEGGSGGGELEGEIAIGDDMRLDMAECTGDNVASESDGVTEDTVNVSTLSIDFADLAEIGFAASDRDPTEVFTVFIDEINDEGGVCGRTIDVQPVLFNILAGEGGQACVEATEDRDNLVVSVASYNEVLCLTDAGVPVISANDMTEQGMEDAGGLLFTRFPEVEAQYEATVQYAMEDGALDGTVGVWYGGVYPDQTDAVEDVVLPMLDDAGVDYTAFRNDSAGPHEPQGNAALSAAAADFVAQDIDTLLSFVQNTNHTGMQTELDAQGLDPRYISMPIAGNTANELFADRYGTREFADGQEWITFTEGSTEIGEDDPIAAACHEIWTRRTGEEVAPNQFDYSSITSACAQVDAIAAAMSLAGGELTRDRFVRGLESLPSFRMPTTIGEVDWTPDNHFGPPIFGVHTYDADTNTVSTSEETFEIDG